MLSFRGHRRGEQEAEWDRYVRSMLAVSVGDALECNPSLNHSER